MPTSRRAALDLFNFDGVLSLDLDAGVAVIDLTRVTFVDAYALTGLACSIASATRDGLPVWLRLPERYDVRSWLSRMHLGDVLDAFDVRVEGDLPKVVERDRRDNLIELERFRDSQGSDRLASFIWERLQGGGADGEVVTSSMRPRASSVSMSSSTLVRRPADSSPRSATRPAHPRNGSSWRSGMSGWAFASRSAIGTAP